MFSMLSTVQPLPWKAKFSMKAAFVQSLCKTKFAQPCEIFFELYILIWSGWLLVFSSVDGFVSWTRAVDWSFCAWFCVLSWTMFPISSHLLRMKISKSISCFATGLSAFQHTTECLLGIKNSRVLFVFRISIPYGQSVIFVHVLHVLQAQCEEFVTV